MVEIDLTAIDHAGSDRFSIRAVGQSGGLGYLMILRLTIVDDEMGPLRTAFLTVGMGPPAVCS